MVTGTTLTTTGNIYAGDTTQGTFTMSGGTVADTGYLMVGYQLGSGNSSFTMNGGTLNCTSMYAGYASNGAISLTNATVTNTGAAVRRQRQRRRQRRRHVHHERRHIRECRQRRSRE